LKVPFSGKKKEDFGGIRRRRSYKEFKGTKWAGLKGDKLPGGGKSAGNRGWWGYKKGLPALKKIGAGRVVDRKEEIAAPNQGPYQRSLLSRAQLAERVFQEDGALRRAKSSKILLKRQPNPIHRLKQKKEGRGWEKGRIKKAGLGRKSKPSPEESQIPKVQKKKKC